MIGTRTFTLAFAVISENSKKVLKMVCTSVPALAPSEQTIDENNPRFVSVFRIQDGMRKTISVLHLSSRFNLIKTGLYETGFVPFHRESRPGVSNARAGEHYMMTWLEQMFSFRKTQR